MLLEKGLERPEGSDSARPGACRSRCPQVRLAHGRHALWARQAPEPGAIFSAERRQLGSRRGRLPFANSDLSGSSIFEEAQSGGVRAAEKALDLAGDVS